MKHSSFTPRTLAAAVILGALLFGATPATAQVAPFDGSQVTVTSDDAASDSTSVATSTSVDILTAEEKELLSMKLLPSYYPYLKKAMQGPLGSVDRAKSLARAMYDYPNAVFSPRFGDPKSMLEWAQRYRGDAAMVKLITTARRGDIILNGHQSAEGQKNDPIAILTGGPYHHAVVVFDGPPGVIIEAIGVTGSKSDPMNNRVRFSSWHEYLGSWAMIRLERPTAGQPAEEAKKNIDEAIKYLTDQLGKPYDFGFTNNDANRAFYCSELAWKSYYLGAGMTSYKPAKSSSRDRMIVALNAVVDGLEPKDRTAIATRVVRFTGEFTSQKPPDLKKLVDFIVDELTPGCGALSEAFPTPEAREKQRKVLEKIRNNYAFPRFLDAQKKFDEAKKSGKFDAGWGIGKARKLAAEAKIATSIVTDLNKLAKESGAGYPALAKMFSKVIGPLYKYMGTYADFLTGMDKEGKVNVPEGAKTVLAMTDWLAEKRENVKTWPLVGSKLASLLPGNGDGKVQDSFVSPTDLAGTTSFHVDYP
ncbi:MAG TPA: YiiX/YebB-like N1pC/P60 family cysteine hydrolase [Candidatus Ozemobacteraceae bacterium]